MFPGESSFANIFWTFMELIQLNFQIFLCIASTVYRKIRPRNRKSVAGKVIVITGAANGIGKELSIQFAKIGALVIALDIDRDNLSTLKSEIEINGGAISTYVCDVTSEDQVKKTASSILTDYTSVDILINNAGIGYIKPISQLDSAKLEKIFKVNIISHFYTINAFLPSMIRQRNGHIVGMASTAAWIGFKKLVDYCATKHAINGLMEGLRQELHAHKQDYIKLTTISPCFIETDLWKSAESRILPIFTTDTAVPSFVDGILREKPHVFLPWYAEYTTPIMCCLPTSCLSHINDFLQVDCFPHS